MESLNVIALISGGKDSFYSLLHCQRNHHRVVALGNLYPPLPTPPSPRSSRSHENVALGEGGEVDVQEEEEDLNSFMYQTVGHTIIPLYEQALGGNIPLYRQEIRGSAVQTGTSYASPTSPSSNDKDDDGGAGGGGDETEDLYRLLQIIVKEHPHANAISTGAILSTYQRTRVESVAGRLGLIPLSFLWQYPVLPPYTQIELLVDMEYVGLEARIVKVASAGLDEGFLWEDVVSRRGRGRVERAMARFGVEGDGGVIGEGGEFETLVVDGPGSLFKGRIVVEESMRRIVREGGGAAWLSVEGARVVMKEESELAIEERECRIPDLFDAKFAAMLKSLEDNREEASSSEKDAQKEYPLRLNAGLPNPNVLSWTFHTNSTAPSTISEEATTIITSIKEHLMKHSLSSTHIISSVIVLRSMVDFAAINKVLYPSSKDVLYANIFQNQVYSQLFTHPNPPSRITISSGSLLPSNQNVIIHLTLSPSPPATRKSLHVQSRSYWAPANIGPYSQAISYPLPLSATANAEGEGQESERTMIAKIAGQIPLIPASMVLPESGSKGKGFEFQTALALQHLWRIGIEMGVRWWVGGVAFIPSSSSPFPSSLDKVHILAKAWEILHKPEKEADDDSDGGEERDLWEEKYRHSSSAIRKEGAGKTDLPDWSFVEEGVLPPPVFVVEVEELPRGSGVEWCAIAGVSGGGSVVVSSDIPFYSSCTFPELIGCRLAPPPPKHGIFTKQPSTVSTLIQS